MKKLLLGLTLLTSISSFANTSQFSCDSKYSEITGAVVVFYKALGGETLSADEEVILMSIQNEMATNSKFQYEVARVSSSLEDMIEADIEINSNDQIAMITGAYFRSCN